MKKIGEVLTILNDRYLLAKIETEVNINEQLQVYVEKNLSTAKKVHGLEKIILPKGRVIVVQPQGKDIYLLSLIMKKKNEVVYSEGSLSYAISGLSNFLGKPKEVITLEPDLTIGTPDKNKSLELDLNPIITIGDNLSKI